MSAEVQAEHLKAIAAEHAWTVTAVLVDRPATVKKDRRPGELALFQAIRDGGAE